MLRCESMRNTCRVFLRVDGFFCFIFRMIRMSLKIGLEKFAGIVLKGVFENLDKLYGLAI